MYGTTAADISQVLPSLLAGFFHPLSGLDHLLAALAVGTLAVRRKGNINLWLPILFVTGVLAGGLIARASLQLPLVEIMIALSLVVAGVATFLQVAPAGLCCVGIIFFAIFHGYAHGVELPHSTSFAFFFIGLLCSTALLHILGIVAVNSLRDHWRMFVFRTSGALTAIAGVGLLVSLAMLH